MYLSKSHYQIFELWPIFFIVADDVTQIFGQGLRFNVNRFFNQLVLAIEFLIMIMLTQDRGRSDKRRQVMVGVGVEIGAREEIRARVATQVRISMRALERAQKIRTEELLLLVKLSRGHQ